MTEKDHAIELRFSKDFSDVLLVDISDPEIKAALQDEGTQLWFKGHSDVVLCSKTSTFAVFSRETSNDLFLFDGETIKGYGAHRFVELSRVRPRLERLRELLQETALSQAELDETTQPTEYVDEDGNQKQQKLSTYSFADLVKEVQASEDEIHKALQNLGAFQEANSWRILSKDLEEKLVVQLVLEINSKFGLGEQVKMTMHDVIDGLSEFPSKITAALFKRFFTDDGTLKEDKLASYFAESLLKKNLVMRLKDFKESFVDSLPLSISTLVEGEKVIERLALVDIESNTVIYLPLDQLPHESKKRVELLFGKKRFWTPQQIEFWMGGIDGSLTEALQKFCRVTVDEKGQRGYVKR